MSQLPSPPPDEPTSPAKSDTALSTAVQQSAQQIWLAGMGAFAKAQEEGGRVFEALVREGVALQQRTHAVAEERIVEASSKIGSMAEQVSSQAGQQWDRLESIFEERVAKSLNRLGMPSTKDMRALVARVEELSLEVGQLTQRVAAAEAALPGGSATPDRQDAAAAEPLAIEQPVRQATDAAPAAGVVNRRRSRSA